MQEFKDKKQPNLFCSDLVRTYNKLLHSSILSQILPWKYLLELVYDGCLRHFQLHDCRSGVKEVRTNQVNNSFASHCSPRRHPLPVLIYEGLPHPRLYSPLSRRQQHASEHSLCNKQHSIPNAIRSIELRHPQFHCSCVSSECTVNSRNARPLSFLHISIQLCYCHGIELFREAN